MKLLFIVSLSALFSTDVIAAPIDGTFIVVRAPRDPAVSNAQAAYEPDDAQLLNRIVTFSGANASFNGEYSKCKYITNPIKAGALFKKIVPKRLNHNYPPFARPFDFNIDLAQTTIVPATKFRCEFSPDVPSNDWNKATLFPIGKGLWALSIIDDFILILKPFRGQLAPSFDCHKGGLTATERTICADPVLAGWDRSLEAAISDRGADLDEQRIFLTTRNACGTKRNCLRDTMAQRISEILH